MEAYQRVKELEQQQFHQGEPRETHQWEPPPEGWHKINVDAAIDKNQQIAGLGVIIKDSYQKPVAAAVRCIKLYGDTSFAEAEAAKWGLYVAQAARLSSVIIESDCVEVVELINKKKSSRTEICWTISDIISSSRQNFQVVKCQHVPRTCNTIAHSLAKRAIRCGETDIWLENFPDIVLS